MELLYNEEEIKARVEDIAMRIERDYYGQEILMVGVLDACFVFMADLVRKIQNIDIEIIFVDTGADIKKYNMDERTIILVDTICDSGKTCHNVIDTNMKSCVLINKVAFRCHTVRLDYMGFIYDEGKYLVGYGLDWIKQYRQLSDIYEL